MEKSITNLNKKSNLFDAFEVGKILLLIVILGFVTFVILSNFSSNIGTEIHDGHNFSEVIDDAENKTVTSLDFGGLAFLITALIFSIIAARKIPVEPLYVAIVMGLSFIFFVISFIISNTFGAMMDNGTLSDFILLDMPITYILLRYFPIIVGIYLGIIMVVFFSKNE